MANMVSVSACFTGAQVSSLASFLQGAKEGNITCIRQLASLLELDAVLRTREGGDLEKVYPLENDRLFVTFESRWEACRVFIRELASKFQLCGTYQALGSGDLFEIVGDEEEEIFTDNFLIDVYDTDNDLLLGAEEGELYKFFKTQDELADFLNTHTNETHTFEDWIERLSDLDGVRFLCAEREVL